MFPCMARSELASRGSGCRPLRGKFTMQSLFTVPAARRPDDACARSKCSTSVLGSVVSVSVTWLELGVAQASQSQPWMGRAAADRAMHCSSVVTATVCVKRCTVRSMHVYEENA